MKEIAAVGKDNAAVTILPAKNNAVKILIESEDHKTQNTFVINLGVADPADDSKDYTGVITPSAGSTQPNNGMIRSGIQVGIRQQQTKTFM